MLHHKSTIPFGIIGLGRFGLALAETLAAAGKEVLVLDNNANKIKMIQEHVAHAILTTQMNKAALEEAGIQNCETVIVCIGEQVETSILTTLNVIELGVPRVISKAIGPEHGTVLQKIGAEVVYPEKDHAIRLANILIGSNILNFIDLSSEYSITEIKLTDKLDGKSILDIDFRKRFNLNVIAIIKDRHPIIEIKPDQILHTGDLIVVVGKNENIIKFESILTA